MVDKITYPLENKIHPHWAVYYDNDGYTIDGNKIMGRQAAGWAYLKALVKSKPSRLGVYIKNSKQRELFQNDVAPLLGNDDKLTVDYIPYNNPYRSQPFGGIFVPGPGIGVFADERSIFGSNSYSLVGITHTTASHRVMSAIKYLPTSRVMPWDSIICTSNVVLDTVKTILNSEMDFLRDRYNIKKFILPESPVIPLGIDSSEFNYSDEYKINSRNAFNFSNDDIVISFVGRLSFHAKAHHYPMYVALEQVAKITGKKIHLIQTGWFGNEFIEKVFREEVTTLCPNINCIFLDGTDQQNKHKTLAASDIFISLSDNIQETFGITPLEGMASGIPVIVSDWNGYKETVRNDIDGYKIKTISASPGSGMDLAYNHMIKSITYDLYIGLSAQRVAIDINDLILKLKILVSDKEKRFEMGNAARKRAKNSYDWKYILDQYIDLGNNLDKLRTNPSNKKNISLPSDRLDPFSLFSSYPSLILNNDLCLYKADSLNISLKDCLNLKSINFGEDTMPKEENLNKIYGLFNSTDSLNSLDIIKSTNLSKDDVNKGIIFLLKYGFLSVFKE